MQKLETSRSSFFHGSRRKRPEKLQGGKFLHLDMKVRLTLQQQQRQRFFSTTFIHLIGSFFLLPAVNFPTFFFPFISPNSVSFVVPLQYHLREADLQSIDSSFLLAPRPRGSVAQLAKIPSLFFYVGGRGVQGRPNVVPHISLSPSPFTWLYASFGSTTDVYRPLFTF